MEVYENFNKYNEEEMGMIKEISNQIFNQIGSPENKIITKKLFFDIYIALIISIPFPNIFEIYEEIDHEKDKILQNLYDDFLNLKKTNFSSKDFKKKIQSKSDYYERAYKIRIKIQNCEYNYHNLAKGTVQFIQAREIIKIQNEYIQKNKIGNIQCQGCGTKWLNDEKDKCPVCEKEEDLNMYITLVNFFNMIGDMQTFYKCLDPFTATTLYDNWAYIKEYIRNKNNIKRSSLYNKKIKKIGSEQYKKIIKLDKGYQVSKELFKFNSAYNTALIDNMEELDLREAVNVEKKIFFEDLNKIIFSFCTKIKFGKKINLSWFAPEMPELLEIRAEGCSIKEVKLDPVFFPKLKMIFLNNNEITQYGDISSLLEIQTLKVIDLHDNPIETKIDIYKLEKAKKDLEIRINWRARLSIKNKIDEESDDELKDILKKIPESSDDEKSINK